MDTNTVENTFEQLIEQDPPDWPAAIKSALAHSLDDLKKGEGSLGDFIRLVKMKQEFIDARAPAAVHRVTWVDWPKPEPDETEPEYEEDIAA